MHLLVDDGGVLKFDQATTLDLDGVLYVAPEGTLDLRGGFDGADGHDLTITSDGFALILGRVLLNGTDKLDTTELPPFNQSPFPAAGSGPGKGGGCDDFKYFELPTGGLGGFGTLNRGDGGEGGPAGNITVRGSLFPASTAGPPAGTTRDDGDQWHRAVSAAVSSRIAAPCYGATPLPLV